jgi:hypothetical protein
VHLAQQIAVPNAFRRRRNRHHPFGATQDSDRAFFANRGPVIAASLVVLSFIITRLAFFLHFRLADVAIAYWSYFDVVQQAHHGQWSKLYLRTPGNLLFLAAVFSISRSAMAVVATQSVLTLVAALGTLACFVRVDRRLAHPIAFALVGFTSSMHSVVSDTTLLTESLYSSLLMLSFGTLTLAILRGGAWACVGASFAMTGCIWARPAGLYFLVIYGLVLGWLLLQRRPRRHGLAFELPLAIVVLATRAYNRLTIGTFTITPFGAVNLLGPVATYIEEDPGAPADVNAAVREICDSMTPEDRATDFTSHARQTPPRIGSRVAGSGRRRRSNFDELLILSRGFKFAEGV